MSGFAEHICGLSGIGFNCPACEVIRDGQEKEAEGRDIRAASNVRSARSSVIAMPASPEPLRQALNQINTILRDLDCPLDVRVTMASDIAEAALLRKVKA